MSLTLVIAARIYGLIYGNTKHNNPNRTEFSSFLRLGLMDVDDFFLNFISKFCKGVQISLVEHALPKSGRPSEA